MGNISSIYHISGSLETKFNTDYRTGGISTKSAIYRFGTDKLAKKSRVKRRAKQWRELVKISDILLIYRGNIGDFFESFF